MRPLLALLVLACSGEDPSDPGPADPDPADPDPVRWPVPDWAVESPEEHGVDPAKLDEAAAVAQATTSRCLLVVRDGALIYERYFDAEPTDTHRSWSVAKSYSATAVGIAIDRGDLAGLDQPVADHVPEWREGGRDAITLRDVVRMTSGLEWSAFQDYVQMAVLAPDHTAFAKGLELSEPPGSSWVYHNGAVQILEPLFAGATGMSIEDYAAAHLWSRIGMTATWEKDDAGHATTYANVLGTCRDHARFGYLLLRRGRWQEEQVVSEAWLAQALRPSQELNRAYGYLFWLNGETPAIDPLMNPQPDMLVPFAPEDLFAARGFGNQFIDVIPSLDLIVVRFGDDPTTYDLNALAADARFEKHDDILRPILEAVR